jgi:NAD(P)-dependent dehydrogenase (short-subunit alcohol dehydrogenase family)
MKVWLITGGTHGIGKALCDLVREKGDVVVTCSRSNLDVHDEFVADHFRADVAKVKDARGFVQWAIERYGRIDVLVNCAGVYQRDDVVDTATEDWNELIGTNLNGTFYTCRTAAQWMMTQRGTPAGVIVNVVSYVTKFMPPGRAAYAASKAGVLALTMTLAQEMSAHGVRVNAFSPWKTKTRMDVDEEGKVTPEEAAWELFAVANYDDTGKFFISTTQQRIIQEDVAEDYSDRLYRELRDE